MSMSLRKLSDSDVEKLIELGRMNGDAFSSFTLNATKLNAIIAAEAAADNNLNSLSGDIFAMW